MKLTDKVAIVTAAGRGIGRAVARTLAAEGATVVVNSYGEDTTQSAVDEITSAGGKAIGMPGDITDANRILEVVESTIAQCGKIDILVNNVGAGPKNYPPRPDHPLGNIELVWNALYQQNLLPVVLMTEAVIPHMIERKSGRIVNISSAAGVGSASPTVLTQFSRPGYHAMKAGVISYTQTMADLLGPDNINVNALCPGIVYTDAWKNNAETAVSTMPEFKGMDPRKWFEGIFKGDYPKIFDRIPLQREQSADDMGNAVKFLVSDDSINITGQTLMVDGGMIKL